MIAAALAWLAALSPLAKKVGAGVFLVLLACGAVWWYGHGKEVKGRREATVAVSETRAVRGLDTAKHDFAAAVKTVAQVRVAHHAPRAVTVLRPGVVSMEGVETPVPVPITVQLTADAQLLARDTVVIDSLLFGWSRAIVVADTLNMVKNVYKADAGNHHLVLKVAGVSVGIVGLVLLVHHITR